MDIVRTFLDASSGGAQYIQLQNACACVCYYKMQDATWPTFFQKVFENTIIGTQPTRLELSQWGLGPQSVQNKIVQ